MENVTSEDIKMLNELGNCEPIYLIEITLKNNDKLVGKYFCKEDINVDGNFNNGQFYGFKKFPSKFWFVEEKNFKEYSNSHGDKEFYRVLNYNEIKSFKLLQINNFPIKYYHS
jgi:hypothetical protein